jgi:Mrp family chromosome partitioning ATPase
VDESIPKIRNKLGSIKHKVLVLSGKGGVGKSKVATQLAVTLSNMSFEVGLLDVDICGPSVPTMLRVVGQEVHQSGEG